MSAIVRKLLYLDADYFVGVFLLYHDNDEQYEHRTKSLSAD